MANRGGCNVSQICTAMLSMETSANNRLIVLDENLNIV